jgi:hypothetical protein
MNELQRQLDEIKAKIAQAKAQEKALKKLQSCKLTHKTAHKYYSLQELYMNTIRGQ